MSESRVIKAANFESKNVQFADNVRTNKYNGKAVYVNYSGKPLRVQMPKMSLPFGVSKYVNPDKPEEIRYSLDLSFADIDRKIIDEFKKIEESVIDYAEKNSKELFKKQKSRELLQDVYKSFIKHDQDEDGNPSEKYAPRLKVKIYTEGKSFKVDAYDSEKIDGRYPKILLDEDNIEEHIGKGSKCEVILQSSGLWAVGQNFGVSWVLSQIKIYKNENKLNGYAFQDDELENEDEQDQEDEQNAAEFGEPEEEEIEIVREPETKAKPARRKRELL